MNTLTPTVSPQLPLPTAYYIRKLLSQGHHELRCALSANASAMLDTSTDLTQCIVNLHHEDTDVGPILTDLEQLVYVHRGICGQSRTGLHTRHQLYHIETQIFRLLGISRLCAA